MKSVVRVGINANFNCTDAEFETLKGFQLIRPDAYFFINSNIKTPDILNVNKHDRKVVVTINPDITIDKTLVERFYQIQKEKVAFVRVKYIPKNKAIRELVKELSSKGYNVVITVMRFLSNETVNTYVKKSDYDYKFSWFRLNEKNFKQLESFVDSIPNVYICDRKGVGCSGCGLCSKLTVNEDREVYGLNLSASGVCPFNCVDCYAKKMQLVLFHFGKSPMVYDTIKKNQKQKGDTAHIKANLKS